MNLPQVFHDWFGSRGWSPRPHQLSVLEHAQLGENVLLISPTGGGKTLAGFLPSLVELLDIKERRGIHTLYVSPLKALAVDIARNLEAPVAEMALPVTIETRTGDTPHSRRLRQRQKPPDILITTPEQVSLLVADPHAAHMLQSLRMVILDELHSVVTSKRGVLLSLALTRVQAMAPQARRIGLSATVADPDALRAWLVPTGAEPAPLVMGTPGARPNIRILKSVERVPWSGHSALYAIPEIYDEIRKAKMTLVFVNTRSQAEMVFQSLWEANDDHLPIALHHGSLDVGQRRKVEAAMTEGKLRAVVCTSTLELGIDWGDVDLVIHVGAPKGSSRLLQRIGRSNHRLDSPSEALLVPSNRFEVLECEAALQAAQVNAQDTEYPGVLKLDVLAQHILGRACAGPFLPDELFAEVTSAWTYRNLIREDFDKAVDYVATGGYALKAYERYAKLKIQPDGSLRLSHPRLVMSLQAQHRHHRRRGNAESPAGQHPQAAGQARGQGRTRAGRVGGIVPQPTDYRRYLPVLGRSPAFRRPRRIRRAGDQNRRRRSDGALLCRAENFRCPPISRNVCVKCSAILNHGPHFRHRCATGSRCNASSRWCPRPGKCWSKPSRAPTNITWSVIPSKAAWPIRHSAC